MERGGWQKPFYRELKELLEKHPELCGRSIPRSEDKVYLLQPTHERLKFNRSSK
jgi:hypothetical protein